MASIQTNITDLDDLLIQITEISDDGSLTTFTTAADHGIQVGDTVVISNASEDGYNSTVEIESVVVETVATTTTFVANVSLGSSYANTSAQGQVIVDDVATTGTYYTPEITIDVTNSTFELNVAGNLNTPGTGVTGQALYSFFKERWKEVPSITKYAFPMLSITNEQFEIQNGWTPANDTTRKLIRTAGWAEISAASVTNRIYSGVITLGTLGLTDQPYYTQDDSFTAVTQTTTYTGPVNEAVPIFMSVGAVSDIVIDGTANTISTSGTTALDVFKVGDTITVSGGTATGETYTVTAVTGSGASTVLDIESATISDSTGESVRLTADRAGYFQIYVRTRGKTYADANLADIGVTSMTSIVYRFPVSNATDLNINTTDDNAFTGALISAMSGDGTSVTVDTAVAHGLYEGAPIAITNTGDFTAGNYTVASVTDANTFVITSTQLNGSSETIGGTESVQLDFVDAMSVKYLPNPSTSAGNVRIRGQFADATTYAQGDVVYDGNASDPNKRWYYWDNAASTSGGSDNTLTNSTGGIGASAWTLWSSLALDAHGERQIAADTNLYSAFSTIYDLNSGGTTAAATKEIAYEYAQYLLRSTSTIDTGSSRNGDIADPLVYFIGTQLHTYADPNYLIESVSYPSAVYAADIAAVDKNLITFHDYADSTVTFPLTVTLTINFNDNLNTDINSKFYAYYTTTPNGNNFGESDALLVVDDSDNKIFGSAYNQTNQRVSYAYAYDQDTTGGRVISPSAGDVGITVVGIGLSTGQYVVATGTITNTGATISLVSPLERNYSDPNG